MASRRELSLSASTRRSIFMLVVSALVVSAALLVPTTSASAAGERVAARAAAVDTGAIAGHALTSRGTVTKLRVLLFDDNFTYIRDTKTSSAGGYQFLNLPPGFYRVQFMDARPRYDIRSFGTTDIRIQVRVGQTSVKDARMSQGAFITGVVRSGPQNRGRAGGAKVAVANAAGRSFDVLANSRGEFALGGLAPGKYTLWAWDRAKQWSNKPINVTTRVRGRGPHIGVPLRTRSGAYHGFLFAGPNVARGTVWATLINRSTGQWYPFAIKNGDISIKGLMPGYYRIQVNGAGDYLGGTFNVPARVNSSRSSALNPRLTKLGGWFTGVVKSSVGKKPLKGVNVSIFDQYGGLRNTVVTAADGTFRVGGSLETQPGMTMVVEAYERIDGATYAEKVTIEGLSATAGQGKDVGEILMVPVTGPETTVTAGPAEGSTSEATTAVFEFTGSTGTSRYECRLDGATFATCSSPKTYSDLDLGKHTFEVRAVNAAGTADATPVTRTFTVADTTAPTTTITLGPDEGSKQTSKNASFSFTGAGGHTKFQCSLDGAAFADCTSPHNLPTLTVGAHKFQVRAVDGANNVDATPETRNFTVLAQ